MTETSAVSNPMWGLGIVRTFGASSPPPMFGGYCSEAETLAHQPFDLLERKQKLLREKTGALRSPCFFSCLRVFTYSAGLQEGDICDWPL